MAKKIEKSMYQQAQQEGITLTALLEKERPSEKEGLDAFEFALFERKINLRTDRVERFYQTHEDSVLFPEFINRNVRIGIAGLSDKDVTLADLVGVTNNIDSGVYQSVQAEFNAKKIDFKKVAEGAPFPTVTMTTAKNSITLAKIGVELQATYEVLRRMKLPLLSIHMQLIGKRLAQKMVAYAVYVLINGDGNTNPAPATDATALGYDALLKWGLGMDVWESTCWFAKKALLGEILTLDEFKDSRLFDTARTGTFATPFGNPLKKFNWDETNLGDNLIFQIDKRAALEMINEAGAELIETDKVIDKQLEKTVISNVCGFAKIFTEAAMIFTKATT